jgi:hypothetical protein
VAVNSSSRVLQPGAFLLELDLLGAQLFDPDEVSLLLQVEGGQLVAQAGEFLGGGEAPGLQFAQPGAVPVQFALDLLQRFRSNAQRLPMLLEQGAEAVSRSASEALFLFGRGPAFLGLGDLGEGTALLPLDSRRRSSLKWMRLWWCSI